MIGILCRVLARKFPPSLYKAADGFSLVYPMYFADACVSSSCVYRRRIEYGFGKINVDQENYSSDLNWENDSDDSTSAVKTVSSRASRKKGTEYLSDDSDEDEDEIESKLESINISFVKLPRKSPLTRNELQQCTRASLNREGLCMIKEVKNVKQVMEKGITPEKIFFTELSDISRLDMDLEGIKLYKIHKEDAPYGMQGRKSPPFFAIFDGQELEPQTPEVPAVDSIPCTIICDNITNSYRLFVLMSTAIACGVSKMLFTSGFSALFPSFYLQKSATAVSQLPLEFSQSWESIDKRFGSNVSIFVMEFTQTDDEKDLPTVDLNEADLWKNEELVLVLTQKLTEESKNFCRSRNAQIVTIKGANPLLYRSLMSSAMIAFQALSQWEAKSKAKPKTKVNEMV